MLSNATNGCKFTPKYSSYDERIRYTSSTDSKNVHWEGIRGESKFISNDSSIKEILKKHNVDGVNYKSGMPYFSPFTIAKVKIKMTSDRANNFKEADKKLAEIKKHNVDGVNYKSGMPYFSPFTIAKVKIKMTSDRANNFKEADKKLAEIWSNKYGIPSKINTPIFKNFGGVGECKKGEF